jgi:hypothetical protein
MARYSFSHRAAMRKINMDSLSRPAASMRCGAAVLSVVLSIALLISSLHHFSCFDEGRTSAPLSSIAAGIQKSAPSTDADRGLPGHCHCLCQVFAQSWVQPVSSPVEFADTAYDVRQDHLPPDLAGQPPFEPPRA